jgi:hypothetical protein
MEQVWAAQTLVQAGLYQQHTIFHRPWRDLRKLLSGCKVLPVGFSPTTGSGTILRHNVVITH